MLSSKLIASVNLNYVSNGKQKRIHCKSFLSFTMKHIAIYFGVRKMDGVCYIHCFVRATMCNLFQFEIWHLCIMYGQMCCMCIVYAVIYLLFFRPTQSHFTDVNSLAHYLIRFLFIAVSTTTLMNANCDSIHFAGDLNSLPSNPFFLVYKLLI